MEQTFVLTHVVSFGEVDREQVMSLAAVVRLLQEVAIGQANQYDIGTRSRNATRSSWVLNRMAFALQRYPNFEESLRIETWSRGIHGFRGYREYRICAAEECLVTCSSLWIYIDLATKSPARVPEEVAATFPFRETEGYFPDLDRLGKAAPDPAVSAETRLSLRYSDVDANLHVNNTAYLEFLQTALADAAEDTRPREVQIRFVREILPDARSIRVLRERKPDHTVFSIGVEDTVCAQGVYR